MSRRIPFANLAKSNLENVGYLLNGMVSSLFAKISRGLHLVFGNQRNVGGAFANTHMYIQEGLVRLHSSQTQQQYC